MNKGLSKYKESDMSAASEWTEKQVIRFQEVKEPIPGFGFKRKRRRRMPSAETEETL